MKIEELIQFGEDMIFRHLTSLRDIINGSTLSVENGKLDALKYYTWRESAIQYVKDNKPDSLEMFKDLILKFETSFEKKVIAEIISKLKVYSETSQNESQDNSSNIISKNDDEGRDEEMKRRIKTQLVLLAQEGEFVVKSIQLDKSNPFNPTYSFTDKEKYLSWKHNCLRFVETHFPNDYANSEIKELFNKLKINSENKKSIVREIIMLLDGLRDAPINNDTPKDSNISAPEGAPVSPNITIHTNINNTNTNTNTNNNNNNNLQSQHQTVSIDIDVLQSLFEVLNNDQKMEIRQILESNIDDESKKESIIKKILSFGSNVAASILGGILSNMKVSALLSILSGIF